MTLDYKVKRFGFHALIGPITFLNGIPEKGPRNPDLPALVGGLIGTGAYLLVAEMVFGL